jgi:16S rRNA (guanine1516-N2)-methyltransferase
VAEKNPRFFVWAAGLHLAEEARVRADFLKVPLRVSTEAPEGDWGALRVAEDGLSLMRSSGDGFFEVSVDFDGAALAARRKKGGSGELLFQAVGRVAKHPCILDVTAGFGRDAFLLASRGHTVTAVERHPILSLLWVEAMARKPWSPATARIIEERLSFIPTDSRYVLAARAKEDARPEVVYIDPMFPQRRKPSAKVKKEAQILQLLVGEDAPDAEELVGLALACATKRVVVKRPLHAPHLGPEPSEKVAGKAVRFDVYLCAQRAPEEIPQGQK